MLHYNGKLRNGRVSGEHPLSTARTPVDHYHPGNAVHRFEVPQRQLLEWEENLQVQ